LIKLGERTPENRSVKTPHPIKSHGENVLDRQLENVALQLEAARRLTFSAFITTPCRAKFEVAEPIHYRITITYITILHFCC